MSLALGLFQDFGTKRPTFSCGNGQTCTQAPVDWVEGQFRFLSKTLVLQSIFFFGNHVFDVRYCYFLVLTGVAIMVAVIIVVVVGSMNDWQKERQFKKLNEKKEDRTVKVIRSGAEKVVNIKVSFNCFFLQSRIPVI